MIEVFAGRRREPGGIQIPMLDRPIEPATNFFGPNALDDCASPRSPHLNDAVAFTVGKEDDAVTFGKIFHSSSRV